MARYSFDISTFIGLLLPIRKRKPKTIRWLKSLLSENKKVHNEFIDLASEWDRNMLYSPGHKMQVERMLNDTFGNGITITNNTQQNRPTFTYDDNNALNVYAYNDDDVSNVFVVGDNEFYSNFKNYTVSVPASLGADLDKISAELNRYTRSGITYEIILS